MPTKPNMNTTAGGGCNAMEYPDGEKAELCLQYSRKFNYNKRREIRKYSAVYTFYWVRYFRAESVSKTGQWNRDHLQLRGGLTMVANHESNYAV